MKVSKDGTSLDMFKYRWERIAKEVLMLEKMGMVGGQGSKAPKKAQGVGSIFFTMKTCLRPAAMLIMAGFSPADTEC